MVLGGTISEFFPTLLGAYGYILVLGCWKVVMLVAQSTYAPWGFNTSIPKMTSLDPEGMTYMFADALKLVFLVGIIDHR